MELGLELLTVIDCDFSDTERERFENVIDKVMSIGFVLYRLSERGCGLSHRSPYIGSAVSSDPYAQEKSGT